MMTGNDPVINGFDMCKRCISSVQRTRPLGDKTGKWDRGGWAIYKCKYIYREESERFRSRGGATRGYDTCTNY